MPTSTLEAASKLHADPSAPAADESQPRAWYRNILLWTSLFILTLGAVEDLYGNTDSGDVYGSDAVQYLDVARAIARHDWRSALNPLWSQGYPALLAILRPIFPATPLGDWQNTRTLNFLIFAGSYAAFLWLLFTLLPQPATEAERKPWQQRILLCLLLFAALQTCLGQVSRVNPDELVTTLFLLGSTQLIRIHLASRITWPSAIALALTLAAGFLAKTVFLPLGTGILAIAGVSLWLRRARLAPLLAAAALFALTIAAYGTALSHATGYATVGESGALNYAWHVNRLQKWVHWEGGTLPPDEAWPKPSIARFAQWSTQPPDFGHPQHPSTILQHSPTVYGFAAPTHATYVPYFDPPYFYRGYHHFFRTRYQLIALGKSLGDLLQVLISQPILLALVLVLIVFNATPAARPKLVQGLRSCWPLFVSSGLGILYYLPVHLEGRYLVSMFLVLGTCALVAATDILKRGSLAPIIALLLLGFVTEVALYQTPVWRNLIHHKSPQQNPEWRMGIAASHQDLPLGSQIGVVAWTPSLHSDWAYIAHLQITSEIASGPDYEQFWHLSSAQQSATLDNFRRSGATAVFVNSKPPGLGGSEWRQLEGTPLWMAHLP